MKRNPFAYLVYWLLAGTAFAVFWSSYGCASIGAPTGGPRDSLPPVLIKAVPENFTSNFKSRTIVLNFSEYVELNAVFEKLVINPPIEKFPVIDRKLNTVTIRIKDTLEANTTYSWRFDEVISDVNEGNPLGDFTYVFSTGPTFDSATFSGRVLDAQTGGVDSTLIVLLHNNLSDTAVAKLKPRYVTKLDGKGFFRFAYLAPGTYNVFALKDEGVKRYADSSTPFAFNSDLIQISDSTPPVEMLFFRAKEETKPPPAATETDTKKKPQEDEVSKKPLMVKADLGSSAALDIFSDLKLPLSSPLAAYDSSKILFSDTLFKPITTYTLKPDSTGTNLVVTHNWKLETWYQLLFEKESLTDSAGNTLARNDTIRFKTKGEVDYGALKIDFDGLDFDQKPVLIFLESGKLFKSIPLAGRTFSDKLFKPGEYEIRILLDTNQNGVWDTGDYWTRRQPERTLAIKQKISVRGNWENEFNIDINAQDDPEDK